MSATPNESRAQRLLREGVPFFVVKASEPYARQVVDLIKSHEGQRWTQEDEHWANNVLLGNTQTPEAKTDIAEAPSAGDIPKQALALLMNVYRDNKEKPNPEMMVANLHLFIGKYSAQIQAILNPL